MNDFIINLASRHLIFVSRYRKVAITYLFSLMIAVPKHTLTSASILGELNKSQYSRLLANHPSLAINSLETISKKVALEQTVKRTPLVKGAPWTVAIIIDATLHGRASLHTDNSQKLNHGEGFVIGHQWTNIALVINGKTIPLPPIAFLSKKKCKAMGVPYLTEHERLIQYLKCLAIEEWVGPCPAEEIVVLLDGGYDDHEIQEIIVEKGWDLIGALKKSRGTRSILSIDGKFKRVDRLFRDTKKQSPWNTVRLNISDKKKKRRFRARRIEGNLKGLKDLAVTLVCSEKSRGKKRLHLVSTNTKVSLLQIISGYCLRWKIELFHKEVKSYVGLEDLGAHHFTSQESHVHWVYTAYLLLMEMECVGQMGIKERQMELQKRVKMEKDGKELNKLIQLSSRYCGAKQVQKYCEDVHQKMLAA